MKVNMRIHEPIRDQVHAGLSALLVQARQIWDLPIPPELPAGWRARVPNTLPEIVLRLMVGVGDLARLARDGYAEETASVNQTNELKKELGNILFSTVRWIDDLGLDVLECLDLAIEAQEKFAKSGRPR
jgi:hypothetical protein